MSRYIDGTWLLNFFVGMPDDYTLTIGNLRAVVNDAPSIDIVRCKECRYWRNKDPQQIPTASIMCGHMHSDDFCSYGERMQVMYYPQVDGITPSVIGNSSEKPNNSKERRQQNDYKHTTNNR